MGVCHDNGWGRLLSGQRWGEAEGLTWILVLSISRAVFNYGPNSGGFWDEYYFTVSGERVDEWLQNWLHNPELVKHGVVDDALLHRMEMMLMMIDSNQPGNLDRAAMMLELFLYELVVQVEQTQAGHRGTFTLKVIEDLARSIYVEQQPEEIADRHHISVSTLRRIVHEHSGYPLNEFIHRLKIAEAKNLLLNTEMSVKELAEALGYQDMFYFSRVFKRVTGISPSGYRKRGGSS
ncbi:helix-turn-helix transcriptional regulator [Paenibacillus sp. D2_2]|uniref:helix-turn-helix domain-containing protein n=1 Tax=Paenibacillus sp. D2_2 TaxID=3073092 RepID=UPI0028155844|nr:helix-turn-helix transcriptional regulator [Paenibacillus sp. D2_2]WMT41430.1 helix-turn-helix transcriptional regulator [Paenibacillus sp. D2_2]